jgi:hypothetical protein
MADANFPKASSRRELDIASLDTSNGKGKRGDVIDVEVTKLLQSGNVTSAELLDLKRKYNDRELVDKIMDAYSKKYHQIYKKANKIADAIIEHYSNGQRPFHEIIKKALKYKTKYNMNDVEYDLMRKILTQKVFGGPDVARQDFGSYSPMAEKTRIGKILGTGNQYGQQFGFPQQDRSYEEAMDVSNEDLGPLQEILNLVQVTKPVHTNIIMQSMMYEDCGVEAMTGEYDKKTQSAINHISPVIASMFLPKIDIFESQMLIGSIGGVVQTRYERKPIMTQPDQLLFQDLVSDPNDIACDVGSAVGDLRNRFIVQTKLWQTVAKLRNGQYYEANLMNDLTTSLQNCRNNLYDNADLLYNKDEGDMLRRLLSVFSFRPTFISTTPIFTLPNFGGVNPLQSMGYGLNNSWQQPHGHGNAMHTSIPVTTIPMVVLRLPVNPTTNQPWANPGLADLANQGLGPQGWSNGWGQQLGQPQYQFQANQNQLNPLAQLQLAGQFPGQLGQQQFAGQFGQQQFPGQFGQQPFPGQFGQQQFPGQFGQQQFPGQFGQPNWSGPSAPIVALDLKNALSQTIFINEKKTIVPKIQNIIYSKDVLIFYVNRRVQKVNIKSYAYPFNFNQLPLTVSGFERLNKQAVNVPPSITLGREEETFQLRSVVTVEETMIGANPQGGIITGSTALIMKHRNFMTGQNDENYYLYDPFGASLPFTANETANVVDREYYTNKPISVLPPYAFGNGTPGVAQVTEPFFDRARTRGTIFIYAKPKNNRNVFV